MDSKKLPIFVLRLFRHPYRLPSLSLSVAITVYVLQLMHFEPSECKYRLAITELSSDFIVQTCRIEASDCARRVACVEINITKRLITRIKKIENPVM